MSAAVRDIKPLIRTMRAADVEEVAAIERTNYDFPWSADIFRDCLRVGYRSRVMTRDGLIIGYGILSVAASESHLMNLGVRPQLQGLGLGRRMLSHLIDAARGAGARRLFLEVRPSNTAALQLYDTLDFVEIGVRRDYYNAHGGREDAIVLARILDPL